MAHLKPLAAESLNKALAEFEVVKQRLARA
jgi:hypothetical protein